jgi:hypothetical protein
MDAGEPATRTDVALEGRKLGGIEQRWFCRIEVIGAIDSGNEDNGLVLRKVSSAGERRARLNPFASPRAMIAVVASSMLLWRKPVVFPTTSTS